MAPFTEQLLTNLFKALALPGSAENEYIMKGKPAFLLSSKNFNIVSDSMSNQQPF